MPASMYTHTLVIIDTLMQEDGASAALKALILKIESVCVSVLKTQGSFRF